MAILKSKAIDVGLRITFRVPKIYVPYLEVMDNQSVGIAIREAMRSAGRPAAIALKSLLKSELMDSEQSTGATERAVSFKYGRSKIDGRRFYLVVGINTTHFEYHTSKLPSGVKTRKKRGKLGRGAGLFGLQTRMNKKFKLKSKQVFSRYRAEGRIKASKGKPFKRRPRNYFRFIDRGFNHRNAGRVEGYQFIRRLQASLSATMQKVFEDRLRSLIIPVIKRELLRKWKRVLK